MMLISWLLCMMLLRMRRRRRPGWCPSGYDPYEGLPFYHAVASFTKNGYDDAECERSEWRVRIPDGYEVDWNASETARYLYRDGDDDGAVPEVSLTRSGHAGRKVLFYFGDGKALSLSLLEVNDK